LDTPVSKARSKQREQVAVPVTVSTVPCSALVGCPHTEQANTPRRRRLSEARSGRVFFAVCVNISFTPFHRPTVFVKKPRRLQQSPFFRIRSVAAAFPVGIGTRFRGCVLLHCATPRRANSVTAALGMRLLPGRISTQGKAPSRSMRQIDVLLRFNARAACAIDNSRRSPGSVAPSISPDKMLSMRRSTPGFAANIALSLCSVVNMRHLGFVRTHHAPAR